jgi:hypothetical protein
MQVSRRAALLPERVLNDEEAIAILRDHFEDYGANAKTPMFAKAVFAGGDPQCGWQRSRSFNDFFYNNLLSLD